MITPIKSYYYLTKPGIIYGNVLSTVAGFLLAAGLNIDLLLFFSTILGTALVIASACVINNYTDREIDKKMKRTKNRALAKGLISRNNAFIFAGALGFLGFGILILFTNYLVVFSGIIAMVSYTVFYGITKRKSPIGTLVGTVPGAMPLVAGYLAVTNSIDLAAFLLFFIMVFWQLPHFYAIGIFRLNDYREAGIPILPVVRGVRITKIHMLLCMVIFVICTSLLTYFGYTGKVFLIVMLILGGRWILMGIKGLSAPDDIKWARKVFFFSIIILMSMSALLSFNVVLP
jgi:heme o synthase